SESRAVPPELLNKIIELIASAEPDLWTNPKAGYIFSGRADLVFGHQDERRTDAFRLIQGKRLGHISDDGGIEHLPLTVWLVHASKLFQQGADAYRCRAGILSLVEAILAALASPLYPPRVEQIFRPSASSSSIIPDTVDISLGIASARTQRDLRDIL